MTVEADIDAPCTLITKFCKTNSVALGYMQCMFMITWMEYNEVFFIFSHGKRKPQYVETIKFFSLLMQAPVYF